jgi:hypothetical protein
MRGSRLRYLIVIISFFEAGCAASNVATLPSASTPTPRPGLLSRELSTGERTAIGKQIAQSLKDPDSAQFRWVPVKYAASSKSTEYCAQVNGKNSYGGYTGFQMFHATIFSDARGQYSTAALDDIIVDNATGDDLNQNVKYLGMCIEAGY